MWIPHEIQRVVLPASSAIGASAITAPALTDAASSMGRVQEVGALNCNQKMSRIIALVNEKVELSS